MRLTMTTIKLLLLVIIFITSCAPMSDIEWKQKKMLKEDKRMMRKVQNARKFKPNKYE